MRAPLCVHCTSHDRRACEGVRRFATITASCSCGCHFVPQAGGAVVLVSADALAAAEVDRDAQRTRAEAAEAEVARLRAIVEQYDADARAAAGELLVPIPAPGTDAARVMVASRIMRGQRDEARTALADLRWKVEAHARAGWEHGVPHDLVKTWRALARVVGAAYRPRAAWKIAR